MTVRAVTIEQMSLEWEECEGNDDEVDGIKQEVYFHTSKWVTCDSAMELSIQKSVETYTTVEIIHVNVGAIIHPHTTVFNNQWPVSTHKHTHTHAGLTVMLLGEIWLAGSLNSASPYFLLNTI